MTQPAQPSRVAEHIVDVGGFPIRYWSGGSGPTLVHLHGGSGPVISPAYDLLAQPHRLVAFELPGYGASAEHPEVADTRDIARVMVAAMRALDLGRVHLLGSSLGGKIALWIALDAPELVETLVLESPAAIRPHDHSLLDIPPQEIPRRVYAHPERIAAPPPDPAQVQKHLRLTLKLQGPNRDEALESRLPEVRTPTLVIFGERDGMVPPEVGPVYCQLLPDCRLVLLADAAHASQRERPEVFALLVSRFVDDPAGFTLPDEPGVYCP